MLTFLVGGARSGKSTLAVQMGEHHGGAVTFVATAEGFDDDLRERITRHRDERPEHWLTVEAPLDLGAAIAAVPFDHLLIVDCLTLWLANLLVHEPEDALRSVRVEQFVSALRARAGHTEVPTVIVSNEVGLGIHPDTSLGRSYRDELGRLNQTVAGIADRTLLMVAGRALRLENSWDLLR
ncbi:MAG: bifunctional adenosylcobinamide kinase/adenosylcobinamide-phosphate guanylyltransferase [Actinobacteria bacterium]|uniref:Adenosylcobinamide kinase n=1 Tax=freshwater metagenome TaxID=449393 RepID=A0A6J7C5I6_9ZZZZ|nr:bifunctional adenosylcobinamide kinase/adenosylcobinamide-phosphate guanylyltransferase [Actinomycetota bacterium]